MAEKVIRILLGLMMIMMALNKFLQFMPMPMSEEAKDIMGTLSKDFSILPVVGLIEIVGGILLVVNKFKGLAIVLLGGVLFNVIIFHLTVHLASIPGGLIASGMLIFLAVANKDKLKGLFE